MVEAGGQFLRPKVFQRLLDGIVGDSCVRHNFSYHLAQHTILCIHLSAHNSDLRNLCVTTVGLTEIARASRPPVPQHELRTLLEGKHGHTEASLKDDTKHFLTSFGILKGGGEPGTPNRG